MALAAAGTVSRNASFVECVKLVVFNGKTLLRPQSKAFVIPSATIISKTLQDPNFRSQPWPWKEKGYNLFHYLYEKTLWRFNENTKMILVEGPIASGKSTLAKQLADDLDMCYFCEPTADMWHTNEYGFNKRDLNCLLPKDVRFINKEDFYREPTMRTATMHQIAVNQMSLIHYMDALAHLLNSGQGVVLDRAIFSNIVNILSLIECGYIRPEFLKYYQDCYFTMKAHMLRPHLVIYLDIPVEVVLERVKKRCIDYEMNTPVLSRQYLSAMEKHYKQMFLPDISSHAELLVYDWSHFGDAEVVVEDIELINFDKHQGYTRKLDDWRVNRERQWGMLRRISTNARVALNTLWKQDHTKIPEMFVSYEDYYARQQILKQQPTEKYAIGYNADAGDGNIWFKAGSYGLRFRGGQS